MHACMLGHPSAGSRLHLTEKCGKIKNNRILKIEYVCIHACLGISQLEAGCPEGRMRKKLMKN